MIQGRRGWVRVVLSLLGASLLGLAPAHADVQIRQLCAVEIASDARLACLPVADGERWSVLWHHSVKGFEVEDIYENRGGRMVLVRSHLPDFAAGLDHIPGRGRQVSDGQGGYWIEDLDEAVPGDAYVLRPGRGAVNHRLRTMNDEVSLSAMAPRARVRISLTDDAQGRE